MMKRRLLVVISFAVLCLAAAATRADMFLYVDIENTILDINPGMTVTGDVGLMSNSTVDITLYDDALSVDNAYIHNLFITEAVFDAGMNLAFSGSGETWSAMGDVWLTDTGSTNVIAADFFSNLISITGNNVTGYELEISGYIAPTGTNEAILLDPGSGNPWTFTGEYQNPTLVDDGQDGELNQVSIENWDNWDGGTLVVMHYSVGTGSLATLLTTDYTYTEGDVEIKVVPIPAAVVLGLLGLGVVGLKLRKYA